MVSGISHLTFVVRDLERALHFFEVAFGAREFYDSGGVKAFSLSAEKFLSIGGVWVCIMEGEPPAEKTYTHVAFSLPEGEFDAAAARIESLGVEIRPPRPRASGEGRSIYFYDWDNHLFELHAGSLDERMAAYGLTNTLRDGILSQ